MTDRLCEPLWLRRGSREPPSSELAAARDVDTRRADERAWLVRTGVWDILLHVYAGKDSRISASRIREFRFGIGFGFTRLGLGLGFGSAPGYCASMVMRVIFSPLH